MRRRAAKTDANHAEIRQAFRALGCSVADTSAVGGGFSDLVVARAHKTCLVEVKDGSLPASRRKLTTEQETFRASWHGVYAVVGSLDDVEALVTLELSHKFGDHMKEEVPF